MTKGVRTIIYPVSDIARAKSLFSKLAGVEPSQDTPYYVGFRVGDQDIGLDPNGHKHGTTPYWHVPDIKRSWKQLLDGGAQTVQDVKDVGGGRLTAVAKDSDGNIIGLIHEP